MLFKRAPKFLIHFNDGAFIQQLSGKETFNVKFIDNNTIVYQNNISKDSWLKSNRKYFTDWKIQITNKHNELIGEHHFDLDKKRIRINIDSKCLGDTLAWLPQIDRFAAIHSQSVIYVSQFLKGLGFQHQYPDLRFIDPEETINDIYATYSIGYYFDNTQHCHPNDPRTISLGQVAADVLGIQYNEIRPRLTVVNKQRNRDHPYVCIATQSTAGCKLWHYKDGWQSVVDYLNSRGLSVVVIQKEPCHLNHVINQSGDLPLQDRLTELMHCEFFIGLGSGLSWLAWALKKPVILISGFSLPHSEFTFDCIRINNSNVCHGCWNSPEYVFDRDDWNWCPKHQSTPRQFECSKTIHPKQIFQAIDSFIEDKNQTLV